jgi:hypothetical protein
MRYAKAATALAIATLAVVAAGCTTTKTVPGPKVTVTATQTVPGPTVTQTVSAPPPAPGATIGKWSGTGNQVTPAFNVPDSGNYIVTWSYYGNVDTSLGSSQATNFSIQETGGGSGGDLPNDIAASGSGSTEVTSASGTDSFNVQAIGHWTITVKSA